MARLSLGIEGMPNSLRKRLKMLGEQLSLARKRRGLTMQDMAERMFVTRKTLKRLEDGDPGCSIGVLSSALMVLGLEEDLNHLADPDTDHVGNAIDRSKYAKTKRVKPSKSKQVDMNF
jgi:transcriptional regulator with XRE-family HTH domain